jgi:hypothetical protein
MLSLALVVSLLAVSPPALPDETAPVEGPTLPVEAAPVEDAAPVETTGEDAIVVAPIDEGALPLAPELGGPPIVLPPGEAIVIVDRDGSKRIEPLGPRMQAVPKPPWSGAGRFVGGVTAISLGSMAAVATSIAVDMDLDAPRSIPAGWATAGVGIAGGTALLIAGVVRRVNYGKWRDRITGMPMVAPTRAGATIGLVGQF